MSPGYLPGECMSSRSGGNKFSLRQMEQFSLPVVKREKFKKFLTVIIYRNKHFLSLKKGKASLWISHFYKTLLYFKHRAQSATTLVFSMGVTLIFLCNCQR